MCSFFVKSLAHFDIILFGHPRRIRATWESPPWCTEGKEFRRTSCLIHTYFMLCHRSTSHVFAVFPWLKSVVGFFSQRHGHEVSVWILTGPKPRVLLGLLFLQMVLIGKDPAGKDRQSMQYSRLSRWRRQRSGTGALITESHITSCQSRPFHTETPLHGATFYTLTVFTPIWRLLSKKGWKPDVGTSASSSESVITASPCTSLVSNIVVKSLLWSSDSPTALGTCGASEATCERSWLGSHSRVRWRRQRWETGSKCGAISETEICFSLLLLRYQSRPHVPSKGHKWKHISCITDSTRIHNHGSWSIM